MLQPCGPRSQADSIAGLVYAANVHVEASDLHPSALVPGTFEPVAVAFLDGTLVENLCYYDLLC